MWDKTIGRVLSIVEGASLVDLETTIHIILDWAWHNAIKTIAIDALIKKVAITTNNKLLSCNHVLDHEIKPESLIYAKPPHR